MATVWASLSKSKRKKVGALVVKDGELLDWENNKFEPTRKVMGAYKFTEKETVTQLSLF